MPYANSFASDHAAKVAEHQKQLGKASALNDWAFRLLPMWTTDNAHEAANVAFAESYALQYNRLVNGVPVSELIGRG